MTFIKQYIINQTPSFENELESIYRYLALKMNEPISANKFYKKVIKEIYSLQNFPERYASISEFRNTDRNLRKLLISKYIIIYEIDNNIRSSFHLTYFS